MDTLTFIIEALKALGPIWWPLACVIVAITLRNDLSKLIARLRNYKDKDREINFDLQLEDTKDKFEELPTQPELKALPAPEAKSLPQREVDRILELADSSPRAGILEAWLYLETSIFEAYSLLGLESKYYSPKQVLNALLRAEVVDSQVVQIALQLRDLRNQAVHEQDFNITGQRASTYVSMCLAMAEEIRAAAERRTIKKAV